MSKARDIADLDFNSPDIDGGNIDGATIGGTTPAAGTFSGLTVGGGVAQAIAGVQVSTSSAVSTDALANVNDGHFSIWNTNNSAVYSGLHFRTRTSGSTNALISLDYNSNFDNGELAFRIRNASGSNDKMLSLKGNSGATFSGDVSAIGDIKAKSGNELRVYRTDNAIYGSIEYLTGAGGLKLRDVNGDGMTFAGATSNYLTISGAGAAAFNSNITLGSSTAGVLEVGSANSLQLQKSGVNGYINQSDSGPLIFRMGSGFAERFRIASDGTATFTGGIIAGPAGVSTADHRVPAGAGYITYSPGNASSDVLNIRKYGSTQQKFDQYGVNFPVGIKFGTDTAAANTLDDYEEGTWIPVTKSGSTTISTTVNYAKYVKIGALVYVTAFVSRNDSATLTSNIKIEGLPFQVAASSAQVSGSIWFDTTTTDEVGTNYFVGGTSFLQAKKVGASGDYVTADKLQNGRPYYMSGVYNVAI